MLHILIVDDEPDTHLLYNFKFKKIFPNPQELQISSFLNATDCFHYLKENPHLKVDLILTDINMPVMDGFEFLQKVHDLHPKLPVYMVSAYESPEFRNRATNLGASQFLSKPVDFNKLSILVKKDLGI